MQSRSAAVCSAHFSTKSSLPSFAASTQSSHATKVALHDPPFINLQNPHSSSSSSSSSSPAFEPSSAFFFTSAPFSLVFSATSLRSASIAAPSPGLDPAAPASSSRSIVSIAVVVSDPRGSPPQNMEVNAPSIAAADVSLVVAMLPSPAETLMHQSKSGFIQTVAAWDWGRHNEPPRGLWDAGVGGGASRAGHREHLLTRCAAPRTARRTCTRHPRPPNPTRRTRMKLQTRRLLQQTTSRETRTRWSSAPCSRRCASFAGR